MAYTPATAYPDLVFFQWATKSSPNPRLLQDLTSTATTIYWTDIPYDHNGAIVTGNFLMGIRGSTGYTETIYVPAGAVAVDGLSATNVVRGIRLEGLDYTTGDSTLAQAFETGDKVFCNVSGVIQALNSSALNGDIGSTIKFNARPTYTGASGVFSNRVFADATARDAAITSPQNGDECYLTDEGLFYDYAAGGWTAREQGTPVPNAAEDEAGKVSIATAAEILANSSDTDETGAYVMTRLSGLKVLNQDQPYTYITTAGSSTVLTATLVPAISAYATGQRFLVKLHTTSGASPTINFNGKGAKNIVDANNAALPAGVLPSGCLALLGYDGTSFRLLSKEYPKIPVVNVYTDDNTYFGASSTQFDITNPAGTTFRYTYDGTGTNPGITASTIPTNTIITIMSNNFNANNNGTFTVTGSGTNYFEVTNASGVVESNKTLGADGYLMYKSHLFATWTKPVGLKYVIAQVCGGGAPGGSITSTADTAASGGGAGGWSEKLIAASSLGSTESVWLGAGGEPAENSLDSAGGASAFGSHLSANGGALSTATGGGIGGTATGGDKNVSGGGGGAGNAIAGGETSGNGGNSFFGGGAAGRITAGNGIDAGAYGAGGSGACNPGTSNSYTGGEGYPGVVIVTEFY